MKHVHLTWYLLVDGTHADPNDVAPGDDGALRHKNGLAVALHEDGTPMSIGVGAEENKNVEAAEVADEADAPPNGADLSADAKEAAQEGAELAIAAHEAPPVVDPPTGTKDVKPASPKRYKTREVKGR